MNLPDQHTNSTDIPGNLWQVETRTYDQIQSELDEIEDPFCIRFKSRDRLIANERVIIELVNDDIIYDEVGAIVNPANSELDHEAGLADQISSIGGPIIQNESKEWIENCGEVPVSHSAITRSGKLECQFVIHTVAPDFDDYENDEDTAEEKIQMAVVNSLEAAKCLNVDSISMTALSTGKLNYPAEMCARQMVMAAIKFSALKDIGNLQLIRFNNFKFNDHQSFRSIFKQLYEREVLKNSEIQEAKEAAKVMK